MAVRVAEILDLDIAGVDILFDERGYRVCEANSAPGFQGLEAACGIDIPEMIFRWLGTRSDIYPNRWQRWYRTSRRNIGQAWRALSVIE